MTWPEGSPSWISCPIPTRTQQLGAHSTTDERWPQAPQARPHDLSHMTTITDSCLEGTMPAFMHINAILSSSLGPAACITGYATHIPQIEQSHLWSSCQIAARQAVCNGSRTTHSALSKAAA